MLDSLEASEPMEHDDGAGLSVVAAPSTQPCKDPSGECERAFGMGIFLFSGLAFHVCGDCLQSWAIIGVESIFERPFGDTIALAYESSSHGRKFSSPLCRFEPVSTFLLRQVPLPALVALTALTDEEASVEKSEQGA